MTTTEHLRHIAIYVRISQDKEKNQKAVKRQEADCRALVRQLRKSGTLPSGTRVEVYSDNDTSAYQTKTARTHFERMLSACEAGEVEAVVAYHADRLYRRVTDLYRVAEAVANQPHLTVQTVKSGLVDFSTPSGRLAAAMLALVAQYEVEIKSVRQRSESDVLAKNGAPRPGGQRPFGYDKDQPGKKGRHVVVVEHEAAAVRDATQRLIRKESVSSLIKEWDRLGIKTVRGGTWTHSSFTALMTRPRNAGLRQHRGKIVGPGEWPPIVDPDDYESVCHVLRDPSRVTTTDRTRKHLLSFIVTCSRCQTGMRSATVYSRGRAYMNYQCPGHSHVNPNPCRLSIKYEVAESAVLGFIADRLSTPDADLLTVHATEHNQLRTLRSRRGRLDQDERIIEASKVSTASKARQLEAVNRERQEIDAQVSLVSRRVALASLLLDASPVINKRTGRVSLAAAVEAKAAAMARFDGLPLEQRREIVRSLCHVEIQPSEPGVSYKFGRAYERVMVYARNPITGDLSPDPLTGTEIVGRLDRDGRPVAFLVDDPAADPV